MKRIITLIAVLLVACGSLLARRVPAEKALGYARNWWLQKDGPRNAVLEPVATEFQNIYLFVDTAGRGFVMLAADDRSLPVLGYSLSNDFVVEGMPEHVHDWLQDYDDQIQWLIDNNIEKTNEINAQWKDLEKETRTLEDVYPTAVDSLVTAKWNQGNPYNYYCPSVVVNTTGKTEKTVTGCVATAMAEIMHYHKHPTNGFGSYSYTSETIEAQGYADFANTTYDWNNMIDWYVSYSDGTPYNYNDTQRDAVATLMYHIGVAVEMDYNISSEGGSGALTTATSYDAVAAVNAYKKYFKYKWTATSAYIGDYSDAEWKALLKNEIDNSRPIQYSGRDNSGGHSFVCDGYSTDGRFNFNWGWGGRYNGKYAIGDLHPGTGGTGGNSTYTFNLQNTAIIGIEPDKSTSSTINISAVPNDANYGSVSGSGTYNRYQDIVLLIPTPEYGTRFVNWSNGSSEVPLKFNASGNDTNIIANFERLQGDTLYYCKNGNVTSYSLGTVGTTQYWGILLPSSCLTSGNYLSDVMFYCSKVGTYTVRIYETYFTTTPIYSETYNVTQSGQWVTLPLSTIQAIDVNKNLCIGFESNASFPCSVSSSAASPYGAYGFDTDDQKWYTYWNGNNNYLTWMIKAVTAPPHSITMNATKAHITSATKGVDLRTFDGLCVANKESNVRYEFVSCSPEGIAAVVNNEITATGVGTVTVRAISTPTDTRFAEADATVTLTIDKGTLVFDNHNNNQNWADAANWAPHYSILPDNPAIFDANVNAPCNVSSSVVCGNLSVGDDGVINVASGGFLDIQGTLDNNDASKLVIKADADGSGTLLFDSGTPKATVEMYLKGTANADGTSPDWQLRGSIVGSDFALKNDNNEWLRIHVYEWNEANNASGCWSAQRMDGANIRLEPWKGYGFANNSTTPKTVAYTGTLINTDNAVWTLTKTGSGNGNVGANLLTNSYAAPIRISDLQFSNAESSVIMYNTGSLDDWKRYGGSLDNLGSSPGQYMVSPKETAPGAGMPTVIPSGQSFYVIASNGGATVSANYSNVVGQASGMMYLPAEQERFNVLGITVKSEKGADRVALIECENCTDGYDDGYDGMKFFGNAALPQLYVVNDFGKTSINADISILNQKLGVSSPESGETMEILFDTERLRGFAQLMLHDLRTGAFTNVLADGKYSFVTTGRDEARFEIVGFRMQNDSRDEEMIRVCGNRLFVGENSGRMIMCDMSGKIVWQADVRENEWLELPELLHGVYVIKTENATIKIVK